MNGPQLGTGQVRHARARPKQHAFAYPTFFLLLPMRALRAGTGLQFARNRRAAISFWDRDHGDGREDALAWVDETLALAGITDAAGEVWLHCYPRVLGYAFKPVSFWFCHRASSRYVWRSPKVLFTSTRTARSVPSARWQNQKLTGLKA